MKGHGKAQVCAPLGHSYISFSFSCFVSRFFRLPKTEFPFSKKSDEDISYKLMVLCRLSYSDTVLPSGEEGLDVHTLRQRLSRGWSGEL